MDGLVESFLRENIALLDKAHRAYADDVRAVFSDPSVLSLRVEEIQKLLQERADISERHAALIARDQVLKLNGALSRVRQQNAGITHYKWATAQDERVRHSHAALDGRVFSWAVGTPIGYHPGEDYQCRCVALPVFEDLPEEETEDEGEG